jgi:16S rRNA (guanine1207-N2)-methyltransferase
VGVLARAVLACPAVTSLALIDRDARAVAAAKRNIDDRRAFFLHRDVRHPDPALKDLDFVIMNPPFHQSGARDSGLGQAFIRAAASSLRPGGVCRLVANQTLPYEAALREAFAAVTPLGAGDGYKLYEARR